LNLPSFVVTLGGFLGLKGVMLELANIDKTAVGGVIPINSSSPVYKLVAGNMSTTLSWIVLVVALVLVCNANRGLITPLRGVPWVAGLIYESRLGSMSSTSTAASSCSTRSPLQ
jgi:hypothetical protein